MRNVSVLQCHPEYFTSKDNSSGHDLLQNVAAPLNLRKKRQLFRA